MEIKILQVFYDKNGLPYKDKERKVHFPVVGSGFQGASNTTQIRFYYGELGDSSTTWVATSKLPNGKIGSKVLSTYTDDQLNEDYALLELSSFYFQYVGNVFISLQGYDGGVEVSYNGQTMLYEIHGTPTIQSTGSIKISVNYATQFIGSGEEDNVTLQQLLAGLSSKLDKGSSFYFKHVNNIENINNPSVNIFIKDGDIVYCSTTNMFYDITSVGDTLIATRKIIENNQVQKTNLSDKVYGTDELGNQKLFDVDTDIDANGPIVRREAVTGTIITGQPTAVNHATTKAYVDNLVATIKANSFQVVSSLPSQGEEGIIYLIEVSSGVYQQYIWEGNNYIDLGTTQIDLSNYVLKTTTIAGNSLESNISAQTLTDSLVLMNTTTDIDYVMGE